MSSVKWLGGGWKVLLVILLTASLLIGCGKSGGKDAVKEPNGTEQLLGIEGNAIIAKYQGGEISAAEFEQYLKFLTYLYPEDQQLKDPAVWPNLLNLYIGQTILTERAVEKGAQVKSDQVETFYKQKKEADSKSLKKGETYESYLAGLGLDEQTVKQFVERSALVDEYLLASHTDTELKKIYDENPADYTIASVRHVLILSDKRTDEEAKKLATEIAEQIRAGADFATVANEKSEDGGNTNPDGTKNGGLYSDVPVSDWVVEFKNAAISLPLNEVSDPVKTKYGYHVMRVEKRETRPFDKVKESIRSREAYVQYMTFMNEELPKLIEETNLPQPK